MQDYVIVDSGLTRLTGQKGRGGGLGMYEYSKPGL